jgi:hypothetical protein
LFPTLKSIYRDPAVRRSNELFGIIGDIATRARRRPAAVVGTSYSCVSRAYAEGVHEIITGAIAPAAGAAAMNIRLQEVLNAPARDCQ